MWSYVAISDNPRGLNQVTSTAGNGTGRKGCIYTFCKNFWVFTGQNGELLFLAFLWYSVCSALDDRNSWGWCWVWGSDFCQNSGRDGQRSDQSIQMFAGLHYRDLHEKAAGPRHSDDSLQRLISRWEIFFDHNNCISLIHCTVFVNT